MRTFVRVQPADSDPEAMLVPANQACAPWGGGQEGPCDKCRGAGETDHVCLSCVVDGVEEDCPACRGRVHWRATCPVCGGTGEVDPRVRHGISVFPRPGGLIRYMLEREADLDGQVLVELEGVHSADEDFDADEGALLVVPTRIVETRPVSPDEVERARAAKA